MSAKWNKWLNEEIVYIISEREREIFLKLSSDEQRESFEKMFWEVRDPTPGTKRNEYREEHEERLEYAIKFLGRDSLKPGWMTDRGRMYITLGKPREVQTFSGGGTIHPLELWFYQADPQKNLPPFFYLIFFKRYGMGEYVLYDPVTDGPQALSTSITDRRQAFEAIYDESPELAMASVNYLVSEGGFDLDHSGLGSTMLLARIEDVKNVGVSAEYAERILLGQEEITTRYTFNALKPANIILPVADDRVGGLVNYSFEFTPDQISMGQYEDRIYGALEITARMANTRGVTIYSKTHDLDLDFTPQEFERAKSLPLRYDGVFASIPGRFHLSIEIRNKVSRDYFLINGAVEVPDLPTRDFGASPLLIASQPEQITGQDRYAIQPFQIATISLQPGTRHFVTAGTTPLIFCQIYLPTEQRSDLPPDLNLLFSIVDTAGEEKTLLERALPKTGFPESGVNNLLTRLPLQDLEPGRYSVRLTVSGAESGELERTVEIEIVSSQNPESTVYRSERIVLSSGETRYSIGKMWELHGMEQKAEEYYLEALRLNPGYEECRIALAGLLERTQQYDKLIRALEPLLIEEPNNIEMLRSVGKAQFGLGEYGKAVKYLERLRIQEGDSPETLNLLGNSYFNDGRLEKARAAWLRSLELDSNQPEIKSKLENLP